MSMMRHILLIMVVINMGRIFSKTLGPTNATRINPSSITDTSLGLSVGFAGRHKVWIFSRWYNKTYSVADKVVRTKMCPQPVRLVVMRKKPKPSEPL